MVTASLELSGPEASRAYIEAAAPEHPSLLDPTHLLDSLFGVVNIPNVIWIDEDGIIVRPPEPGWPADPAILRRATGPRSGTSSGGDANNDDPEAQQRRRLMELLGSGQDRAAYADARFVTGSLTARAARTGSRRTRSSQHPNRGRKRCPRQLRTSSWATTSGATASVTLLSGTSTPHTGSNPATGPISVRAWSLVGSERVGGERGRFAQGPLPGEEADRPFESDFATDVARLEPGQYYPKTL